MEKVIKNISLFLSGIFSPLLMPTYGMILAISSSTLMYMPFQIKISVVLVVVAITFLLPVLAMALMYRMGYISGFALVHREERFVPFMIAISSYAAWLFYLENANAPLWLVLFVLGAMLAAIVACVVTRWWKISIHTTSIAGVFAMICYLAQSAHVTCDLMPMASVVVMLLGATASARLILRRHTLAQVAVGALSGFACVYAVMAIAG